MGKANKHKNYHCQAKSVGNKQPILDGDEYFKSLFEPIFLASGQKDRTKFERALALEPEGILYWGVQSGYLLWTRTHPGQIPTKSQIAQWMLIADAKKNMRNET